MSIEPKRKRCRVNATKRWTETEEFAILNYLLDLAPRNKEFEKPNKAEFYQKMTKDLQLNVSNWNQTMNKVKNMRTLYVKAKDWKANTGQGVESGTIEEHVKKMCPQFDALEEIFGHKSNVVPPYVYESSSKNVIENVALGNNDDPDDCNDNRTLDEDIRPLDDDDEGHERHGMGDAEHFIDLNYLDDDVTLENDISEIDVPIESEEENASPISSEICRYRKILRATPATSTPQLTFATSTPQPTSATSTPKSISKPTDTDKENISRFKKRLLKSPVSEKDKTMSRNSSSILAEAQNKKAEAILGRNDIEKIRAENEKLYKLEELTLAKEKFSLEKETRESDLELKKLEMSLREQELSLRMKEIESRERIEKYRIEVEAKASIEIAKLNHQKM